MSIIIESQQNQDYEPTEKELFDYGKWLGMEFPEDDNFLWIAREGLKAPLPEHWKACKSEKGDLYYFNFKTGQSIWDHPMDDHFKELFKSEKSKSSHRTSGISQSKSNETVSLPKKNKGKSSREDEGESGANEVLSPHPKVPKLNALKLSKVVPEVQKVNFEGTKVNPAATVKLSPLEIRSKSKESLHTKSDSATTSDALSSQGFHDEVIARGFSGVKALSRLSSPAADRKSDCSEGEKVLFETSGESTVSRKEEIEKEKAIFSKKMEEELKILKEQISSEQKEALEKYRNELEQDTMVERRNMAKKFHKSIDDLRQEYDEQKKVEISLLEEKLAQDLEEEKKKISESFKKNLDNFREKALSDSQKEKESHSSAMKDVQNSIDDIKALGASFTQSYEENYLMLLKAFDKSFSDTSVKQEKIAQINKELDLELTRLQEDHKALIVRENEKLMKELEELKRNHAEEISEKKKIHESTLLSLLDIHQKKIQGINDDAKRLQELKEVQKMQEDQMNVAITTRAKEREACLATAMSSSQEELEKMKREVVENAKAEIKCAIEELHTEKLALSQRQRSYSLGYQCSSPICSPKSKPSGEFYENTHMKWEKNSEYSKSGGSDDLGKQHNRNSSTPLLSDEVLPSSSEGNDHCVSPGSELGNLRHVFTDILRDIFEKSPFIVTSPLAKERAQKLFSINNSQPPSVNLKSQNDIIKCERERLLEAEIFIENQRYGFEERWNGLCERRHQWKQAVSQAKKDGVRTNTQKGKELRRQGIALEKKSGVLARELELLRQSELWLQKKKQRLAEYTTLLQEHKYKQYGPTFEKEKNFGLNVDPESLLTGYFDPDQVTSTYNMNDHPLTSSPQPSSASRSASPMVASALLRIEERLDKVSSMISRANRYHRIAEKTSNDDFRLSPHTPTHSHSRQQRKRSHFKELKDLAKSVPTYVDPIPMH